MKNKTLAVLLAAAVTSTSALAARPQLEVKESITLEAAPAQVWQVIGQFSDLSWHPAVGSTAITQGDAKAKGAVRLIETKDGAKIEEQLLGLNAKKRSMTYRIVNSPLPVADYVATLSVQASGKGSQVVWSSHFRRKDETPAAGADDDGAKKLVSGIYTSGLSALKTKLAGQ